MRRTLFAALITLCCAGFVTLVGCEEEGPLEEAGEQMDDAMDEAGDAIEDAGDEVEDATDGS